MKEQEARVCLELKLTETEEKMEEQVKELHTSRFVWLASKKVSLFYLYYRHPFKKWVASKC